MGTPFNFGTAGDPNIVTIANSQKENIDAMLMWQENPFVSYNIKNTTDIIHYRERRQRSILISARCNN